MRRAHVPTAVQVLVLLAAISSAAACGPAPQPAASNVPEPVADSNIVIHTDTLRLSPADTSTASLPAARPLPAGDASVAPRARPTRPLSAADLEALNPRPRFFSLTPEPGNRSRTFAIVEASVGYLGDEPNKVDQWLVTNSAGLMLNGGPWSFGGAGQLHWARAHFAVAPSVRVRRWFLNEQSLELTGSYVPPGPEWPRTRLAGPMASARYSPTPMLYFEGGFCRFRETSAIGHDPATGRSFSDSHDFSRGYVAVGGSGPAGAGVWGAEVVVGGVLLLVLTVLSGVMN